MNGNPILSRREVLKKAAVLAATPYVLPSTVFGKDGAVAPANRIALGFIGIGAMGQGHLRIFLQYPDAQVRGVCDVDQWRRETAKKRAEDAYAAQSGAPYRDCAAYQDLRELLARDDIDAVVIATGDNWHGPASVMAAKAGKDIYCEKPISKTIAEARAMADAAQRYGRVFQIGLQQRSTFEFRKACALVREGRIGRVTHVYVGFPGTSEDVNLPADPVPEGLDWELWLGPAAWHPFHRRFHSFGPPPHVVPWHFCRDFGGGNLTSNAVHAFDVVQWGLGMDESGPLEIIPPETGQVPSLTYKYAGGAVLQVTWRLEKDRHFIPEGWNAAQTIQNFGALFIGEQGWIHVGREGFLESHPKELVARSPDQSEPHRPVHNHHQNWLECIKNRKTPACDVAVGCRSTTVSHLGCIAHWTNRALKWDPVKEEFPGDDEANGLRSRTLREPWIL